MKRFSFILIVFFISCSSNKQITTILIQKNASNFKVVTNDLKNWYQKDILKDSIPGVSLEKTYQELLKNKKGKEIIVAVLDTQMDINHEDLKNAIWVNKDEIPSNSIDDDNNGYIDDVNGWNFIGNKKGESLFNANFEYVRVIKKYKDTFKGLTIESIDTKDKLAFSTYKRALNEYEKWLRIRKKNLINLINWGKRYEVTKKTLKKYFPKNNYTIKKLNEIKSKDTTIINAKNNMIDHIEYGQSDEWLVDMIKTQHLYLNYFLNINYSERKIVGDDVDDLNDLNYGYHNVAINQDSLTYHATYIAGILAGNRNNNIGIKGVSNTIKIMPIVISPNGDEFDKDIALAIRYAVDNGAKVISMSSSKFFSTHKNWVEDALLYASDNNVLFITSAGNDSANLDKNISYPTNFNKNIKSFVKVGASNKNKELFCWFSNYGQESVDIFAPGENIYTTKINDSYSYVEGTSFSAPIVAGVAALILSYYSNLKAHQVKEILLASGVSYNIDVEITDENGKKKLVPFSSLSKSGKIVNAYNALLYAKNYKKWKKGKWKNIQN